MTSELDASEQPAPPLIELCSVSDENEGNMVLGLLRSQGIEAISTLDTDPGVLPLGTSEPVHILVLEKELSRAKRILEEHRLETYAVAVVLAAGAGHRMGQPKESVRIGSRTLVEELVETYSASLARGIVVVVAPGSRLPEKLDSDLASVVINPDPSRGPLSSVWAALDEVESSADAILLHPVDVPAFDPDLVDELIRRYEGGEGPILVPTHQGRRGHPALFGKACFPLLRQAALEAGARQVLHDRPELVREVPTASPWVTTDLDTPEDLARFLDAYHPESNASE